MSFVAVQSVSVDIESDSMSIGTVYIGGKRQITKKMADKKEMLGIAKKPYCIDDCSSATRFCGTQGESMKTVKFTLIACAFGVCFSVGAQTYNRIGNTTFGSDGTTYNRIGNTTFGSDGTTYNRIGNTTFGSDGTTYNRIGNTTFGSDGTTANRIGNTTFIDSPNGQSKTCNQIGATTFCN